MAALIPEGSALDALPFTETLLAFGFFLVYGLDEVVHTVLYRRHHSHHSHSAGQEEDAVASSSGSKSHMRSSCSDGTAQSKGHGHSHCPPAGLTTREPRPNAQNSLLRQSAGQHHYGATECHGTHEDRQQEQAPLLRKSREESGGTSNPESAPIKATSGLLALLALSVHAITEGLAIGLQNSAPNVFFLLGAVASHKFVIAFCLGMELSSGWGVTARLSTTFHLLYMAIFSGTSAVGIFVGFLLTGAGQGLLVQALQAIAAGSLLYVTFCEVLPRERAKCHAGLLQFLAVLAGFTAMLALETLVPHGAEETGGGNLTNTTTALGEG